jgi:hypothetical protein
LGNWSKCIQMHLPLWYFSSVSFSALMFANKFFHKVQYSTLLSWMIFDWKDSMTSKAIIRRTSKFLRLVSSILSLEFYCYSFFVSYLTSQDKLAFHRKKKTNVQTDRDIKVKIGTSNCFFYKPH